MIDTHCHIDLYQNPKSILELCESKRINVLSMTNLPSHFKMGLPFFQNAKYCRMALGMHPLYAEFHEKEFIIFEKYLNFTSYIGEVGLDFSREGFKTKDIQLISFERILKLISNQKKILSIHSRRAEKEVLELLIKYKINNAIFHWYSGGLNLIKNISEAGYYFSINPAMIKSLSGQKIISKIPKERILTETDGPFINDQFNNTILPGDINLVINYLSDQWNISNIEVESIIKNNFNRLIKTIR